MHTLTVRNVNVALPAGIELLRIKGRKRSTRNGEAIVSDCPVTTIYAHPWERVLLSPARDANPFFHHVEALWMLAGRDDAALVSTYVKRMRTYSDDGKTLHGAYGKRWREWFPNELGDGNPIDQVAWAIKRLKADPDDRRVVIQMWDAGTDVHMADSGGKDVPCNTQAYVWVDVDGRLSLTVCCRSNDMIWGAHGANAVHFSYLQEYIACALGREMGALYQVSNNYHAYLKTLEPLADYPPPDKAYDPYAAGAYEHCSLPLIGAEGPQVFDEDVRMLLSEGVTFGLRSAYLRKVTVPIMKAHEAYRDKADGDRFAKALEIIQQCKAQDWRENCADWLRRREAEYLRAVDDGVSHE